MHRLIRQVVAPDSGERKNGIGSLREIRPLEYLSRLKASNRQPLSTDGAHFFNLEGVIYEQNDTSSHPRRGQNARV